MRHVLICPSSCCNLALCFPQELEEAARLKKRAEELVHKAYFRYSGAPPVLLLNHLGTQCTMSVATRLSCLLPVCLLQCT